MPCLKWAVWLLAGAMILGTAGCSPTAGTPQAPAGSASASQSSPVPSDPIQHLEDLGLPRTGAVAVWDQLPEDRRAVLRTASEPPEWLSYLAFSFAWPERLDRYESYHQANPGLTAEEAVVRVNIGLDTPPYEDPEPVEDPESLTALVNQYHVLSEDYEPELVPLNYFYSILEDHLRPEAHDAFLDMAQAAAQDGLRLYNVSGYRSYQHQTWSYQRYVREDGVEMADTYSARPGHSEHQTGLALDINTASLSDHFEDSEEYAWLVENAGRFGFILRFPQGKEELTGYQFEPWHYRYVGVETAQLCWEMDWTLEEYTARLPAPGRMDGDTFG